MSATVALEGAEDEILLRDMRDRLEAFERNNADVLPRWNGDLDAILGAGALLDHFLEGTPHT